jgi:hypothetical protein
MRPIEEGNKMTLKRYIFYKNGKFVKEDTLQDYYVDEYAQLMGFDFMLVEDGK